MVEKTEIRKYRKKLKACDDALSKTPDDTNLLLERGNIFHDLEKNEDALNVYQKLLKIESDNFEALVKSGNILYKLGRIEDALISYDSALKIQKDNIELLAKKGSILYSIGKHEDALSVYEKLLKIDPSNISFLIKMADILYDIGWLNDASNAYNKALSKQTKNPMLWVKYASVLANMSQNVESFKAYEHANLIWSESESYEDALKMYDYALDINFDDAGAFYFKGFVLAKLYQNTEAIESYSKAVFLFNESGLYKEALKACNDILEIEPENLTSLIDAINILYNLKKCNLALKIVARTVKLLIRSKRFEDALEICDNGLELKPNDATLLAIKGYTLYKNGKFIDAFEICEKEFTEESLNPLPLVIKGSILSKDKSKIAESVGEYKSANRIWNKFGFHGEALEMCDDVLGINAKDVGALYFKGVALEWLGKRHDALECYKKAIPLFIEAKLYDDAMEACDKALETESENIALWNYQINVLHELKYYENEAKCCCKVAELYRKITKNENIGKTKIGYLNRAILNYEKAATLFSEIKQIGDAKNVHDQIQKTKAELKHIYRSNGEAKPLIPKPMSGETNIKSIAGDEIDGRDKSIAEEYLEGIKDNPDVHKISLLDDELLLYEMYKINNNIVPTLRRGALGYKSEYEIIEDYFSNRFFNVLLNRVSNADFDGIDDNYYAHLKENFINFRYSVDGSILQIDRESGYFGTSGINPALIFFKKVLRQQGISPEYVDEAGNIFIPGSAMFFLELYASLVEKEILEIFQDTVKDMETRDVSWLIKSPVVLLMPWDHQNDAYEAWFNSGKNGIIEMATATGKTLVGLMAIEAMAKEMENGVVRIFAHSRAILNQWRREVIEKLGLPNNPTLPYTKSVECSGTTIYFNTLQSVYKNPEIYPTNFLIVDEVHHTAAFKYRKALQVQSDWKLGLSATIDGTEKIDVLKRYLGPIIYTFSLDDALKNGVLPKFDWKLHTVYLDVNEENEFKNISKLIAYLFNNIRFNRKTIEDISDHKQSSMDSLYDFIRLVERARYKGIQLPGEWTKLQAAIINRRWIIHKSRPKLDDAIKLASGYLSAKKKTILFAMDIDTCEHIAKELIKTDTNVFLVHSRMKGDPYDQIEQFKKAEYGVLIGAKMLDEGIDIPDVEIGINVASSRTRLQLVQRMGRILRKGEGKKPVFHHYIALPDSSDYMENEDGMQYVDDLAWVQDTALKMGVTAELDSRDKVFQRLQMNAEEMVRDRYQNKNSIQTPGYGTFCMDNVLKLFDDEVIDNIILKLNTLDPNSMISDVEWSDLVKEAHPKLDDEPNDETERRLNLPGYWWILVIGDRNPVKLRDIFKDYKQTASKESETER